MKKRILKKGYVLGVILFGMLCAMDVKATAIEDVSNPVIETDASMNAGQKVTYDCIYFGSYPQTELVLLGSAEATALAKMNTYYTTEYETLSSEEFAKLTSVTYDSNGDATVSLSTGDIKVRRIKKSDATYTNSSSSDTNNYYNWSDSTSYHYFKYEPIKWRVLSVDEDGNALVRADKGLDDQKYNTSYKSVTWETSTIRNWLNTADNGFLNTAFTDEEKAVINTTTVENKNNLGHGTGGGNNTEDKIFLLSESEVYGTDTAASYGFVKDGTTHDEARQVRPSTYAYAMGAMRTDSSYAGNSEWWLRSPGLITCSAAGVYDYGRVNDYGYGVDHVDIAVCPALNLNLTSDLVKTIDTVSTDGITNHNLTEWELQDVNTYKINLGKRYCRYSGCDYYELSPVKKEPDTSLMANQKVTYESIYFGAYPQIELVLLGSAEATALEKMNTDYVTEYETLTKEEFAKLTSATYDSNGDTTVTLSTGDIKVRRIKKSDATYTYSSSRYYNWSDSTSYHYFRYDPIKWRVLSVDEKGNALVRADKGLDDQQYNTSDISVTWETSTIRSWLNTADNGFLNTAFTDEEKAAINTTTVENKNNLYYGTNGGNNTEDKVFLLSESEVYSTDTAVSYGFVKSKDTYDEARRVQPSTYAYAMGTCRSTDSAYAGNSYWWLRSLGIGTNYAAGVYSYGRVDFVGSNVIRNNYAVCPALNLNLKSPLAVNGGTVNTDGSGCEEHEWQEDYTIDVAPTCTKIGIKSIHCKFCDAKKKVVLEKMLAHEYTTITSQVDATCTKEGYKKYKCTNCNQTITETIAKTEHNWIKKPSYCVASTCTEAGYDYYACQICSTTKKETIDKLPHDWASDFIIDKKPTCTQKGSKSIHCKVCDTTKDVTGIEKNEHTYNNYEIESFDEGGTTFVETRRCVFCGNKDSRTQNITELIPSGTGTYLNADDEVNYSGFKETPKIIVCRDGKILRDGIDYKIAYSNNLNATINPTKPAKYTINYKGDYKKVKKEVFTFTIEQDNMEDTTIVCGDMINYSKPGVFKSKPYVDLNGFVLKTSDYTISYWLDEDCTIPMDSKHKLVIPDGEKYGEVYVKITGKNKNMVGTQIGSYKVYRKPDKNDSRVNITKCKLQLDAATKKGVIFTGDAFEPSVTVVNGKLGNVSKEYYTVTYRGNIQKGTATIFVTGDGTHAVGTKTINFKIK